MPLFLILAVILVILIRYAGRCSKKETVQSSKDFWRREQEANFTRRADISNLPYIKIPEELMTMLDTVVASLPAGTPDTEELTQLAQDLHILSESRILDLNGQTNTDLKLQYGAANLDALTQYEENYFRLYRALKRAGQLLADHGLSEESDRLLSYAISCQNDTQVCRTEE